MTLALPNPEPTDNPMPRLHPSGAPACTAHKHGGGPCGQPAIRGTDKCRMHAGVSLDHAKARGEAFVRESMRDLRVPAIRRLRAILDDDDTPVTARLAAVKIVVDNTPDDDGAAVIEREAYVRGFTLLMDDFSAAVASVDDALVPVVVAEFRRLAAARRGS